MHQTSTPVHLLFHPCNYRRPMANPWTLSFTPHCILWTIASHTSLRHIPTIVHTQKWTTVYLIHPASQRPASTCIPVLHPSNHCLHVRSHIPAAARTQGMAKGLSHPSNIEPQHLPIPATTNAHTSPCYLPPPNKWTMGRLAHSTSLLSDRRYLHLTVTSQQLSSIRARVTAQPALANGRQAPSSIRHCAREVVPTH
jgi:hypothetical protein